MSTHFSLRGSNEIVQSKKRSSSRTGGHALDPWTKWGRFVQIYAGMYFLLLISLMIVACK